MKQFDALVETIDSLLGPNGCPWDKEQTLFSVRNDLFEETCELIDAIDNDDKTHIIEELGDVAFLAIFLSRLAQKQGYGTLEQVLDQMTQKLIRRHPHVFSQEQSLTPEQVIKQWEEIKKEEKGKKERKSVLDRIPKSLPALARAHEVMNKIKKKVPQWNEIPHSPLEIESEKELGEALLSIVAKAQAKGLNAEHALRRSLSHYEENFRVRESNEKSKISH